MKNFKIIVQYDGSRYKGWQKQKDQELTIQGKLEAVLLKMTQKEVEVIGCERTDVGVHAENYVANFKTDAAFSAEMILEYFYEFLPEDVVVKSVEEVDERFHARYNVKSKIYTYSIHAAPQRDVFNRKYSYHTDESLNISLMRQAAKYLEGKHDFTAFTSVKAGVKSTVRTIEGIQITQKDEHIQIRVTANDFLWHMPRFIIGVLLAVGEGNMQVEEVKKILDEQQKLASYYLVKAKGLCLEKAIY